MITSERFTCVLIAVASSLKMLVLERNQRLGSQRVPKIKGSCRMRFIHTVKTEVNVTGNQTVLLLRA